jgi:hypothetical protein
VAGVRTAAIVALTLLASPAAAFAESLDATSTAKFLTAESRVERRVIAVHEQLEVSADALVDGVESGCPGAVPAGLQSGSAAQQRTWTALLTEAGNDLAVAELHPLRSAVRRELSRLAPLRWTSAPLNRLLAAYVSGGRRALSLHPPDICQQAQAAAQSGFAVVPPGTRAFNARFGSTQSDSSTVALADDMKPLATPGELAGIEQLGHLQSRVNRLLDGFALQTWSRLTRALTGAAVPGTEL